MKRKLFTICLASLQFACAAENLNNKSYEWDIYPVPANAGDGMVWKLHPQSDDFNYIADEKDKGKEFYAKWTDFYHNHWTGPAPTIWQRDHVSVSDGFLKIRASRPEDVPLKKVVSGPNTKELPGTYTGCITSKTRVKYPVYVEAYAKLQIQPWHPMYGCLALMILRKSIL